MQQHPAEDAAATPAGERQAERTRSMGESADALIAEVLGLFIRFPYTLAIFLFWPARAAAALEGPAEERGSWMMRPFTFLAVCCFLFGLLLQDEAREASSGKLAATLLKLLQDAVEDFSFVGLLLNALPILVVTAASAVFFGRLLSGRREAMTRFLLYLFGVQGAVAVATVVLLVLLSPVTQWLARSDDILIFLPPLVVLFVLVQANRSALRLAGPAPERPAAWAICAVLSLAFFVPLPLSAYAVAGGRDLLELLEAGPPEAELKLVKVEAFEVSDAGLSARLLALVENPTDMAVVLEADGILAGVFLHDRDIRCSSRDRGQDRCWDLMRDYPGYLVLLRDVRIEAEGVAQDALAVPGGTARLVRIVARGDGEVQQHPLRPAREVPKHLRRLRADGEELEDARRLPAEVAPLEELIAELEPWIQVRALTRTRALESYWAPARARSSAPWWSVPFAGVTYSYR